MIRSVDTVRHTLTANPPAEPPAVTVHVHPPGAGHCPGCRCQPVIRLGGDVMPAWGYKIIGMGT